MVKKKTSPEQQPSTTKIFARIKPDAKVTSWDPNKHLLNRDFMSKAVLECLFNNDPEGALEVLSIYLNALNRFKVVPKAKITRTKKTEFKLRNPTIRTLAKIMHSVSEEAKK